MQRDLNTAALILAAGFSSRMGDLKPLLPLGPSTLVGEVVYRFRAAGIDDIRVVLGHKADKIAPVLQDADIRTLTNQYYENGMLSSILTGVESLESSVEAFFVLPVDIPLVKPTTIKALVEVFRQQRPAIAYPRLEGLRGHPPLVSVACLAEPPAWDHPGGLKAFLERFEAEAQDVDVIDEGILMDCDTPADYCKVQARFLAQDVPTPAECRALFARCGTPARSIAHGQRVAQLADALAEELNRQGYHLNRELLTAAGLLHDLAKGERDHAERGAELLEQWGYAKVAAIVASHTDLPDSAAALGEAGLVYLADKLFKGEDRVSLEERFQWPLQRFADQPHILQGAQRRYQRAREIQTQLETLLGRSLDRVLPDEPAEAAAPEPKIGRTPPCEPST